MIITIFLVLFGKRVLFNAPSWTRLDVVYNGECIDYVDAFKYLGVWLDSGLKWTVHIEKLNKTLAQVAGVFKRVSSVLPTQTKRMLYFSLFYSHLIYGIAVWGTAGSTALNLLQTTQNKAIKNLFGYHYRTSTALIHSNNRFLSVSSTYTAVACCHVHKIQRHCIHTNTVLSRGEDRHQHYTRRRGDFTASRINTTTFGQNSALHRATLMYNALQDDMKTLHPARYKKVLQNQLLEEQF